MTRPRKIAANGQLASPSLTVKPLKKDGWPIVEQLFGEKGACGGCWCMWPRAPMGGKTWKEALGSINRKRFQQLVESGQVHAVLAFADREPVGWCSFGPRRSFPRLERIKALQREWSEGTWSVVCFYIPAPWRGKGVATQLLQAATEQAFALGAREIEGYPVVPWQGGKLPAAFIWTGVPALFRKAGYREIRRPSATRPIFLVKKNKPPKE
jgi:GNAT superfamily N-acetyltransferase